MIGILANDLAVSQLSYLLTIQANKREDITLYYREAAPLISTMKCCFLPMCEAVHNHDTLIATDLDAANFLRKLPTPARKIFYPWSIEWLRHGNDFVYSSSILNSPLEIIARSHSYAKQLSINGHCDAIIEDFNIDAFKKYMKDHEKRSFYINNGNAIT